MNTHSHLYIAQARADELHRAAALSRLLTRTSRRERLRSSRGYGAVARRVEALRTAPGPSRPRRGAVP